MAEFKHMTVQALRDLARKALGRGYSKLKTKEDLIEALQAAERKVTSAAGKAATRMKAAARATEKVVESVREGHAARSRANKARRKESAAAKAAAKQKRPVPGQPAR